MPRRHPQQLLQFQSWNESPDPPLMTTGEGSRGKKGSRRWHLHLNKLNILFDGDDTSPVYKSRSILHNLGQLHYYFSHACVCKINIQTSLSFENWNNSVVGQDKWLRNPEGALGLPLTATRGFPVQTVLCFKQPLCYHNEGFQVPIESATLAGRSHVIPVHTYLRYRKLDCSRIYDQ